MSYTQQPEPRQTERGDPADEGREPKQEDRAGGAPARDDERPADPERPAGTDGDEATDHPEGIQIQTE